jgi:hypothetical protein
MEEITSEENRAARVCAGVRESDRLHALASERGTSALRTKGCMAKLQGNLTPYQAGACFCENE